VGDGEGVAQPVQGRAECGVALGELLLLGADARQHLVEGLGQLGQLGVGTGDLDPDVGRRRLTGADGLGRGRQLAHEPCGLVVKGHWSPASA